MRNLELVWKGRLSRFRLMPIDRKRLHGFKKQIALDEYGNECVSALLTRDGRFLLPSGSTAETYLDSNGDAINRSELVTVDVNGNSLPTLPATSGRPQIIETQITAEEFLGHVVTKVYALEAESLDPALHKALKGGGVFRVPYRPRPTHTETPAFLLANEHGVFLVQAEPCHFDFVGLEQAATDTDGEWEDEIDADEFTFDDGWEADHVVA